MEWLLDIENTRWLRDASEIVTIILSAVGILVLIKHFMFFGRNKKPLSQGLKWVALTDSFVYFVTFAMGVGLAFNLKHVIHYDIILRNFFLALNIYASIRLYYMYHRD